MEQVRAGGPSASRLALLLGATLVALVGAGVLGDVTTRPAPSPPTASLAVRSGPRDLARTHAEAGGTRITVPAANAALFADGPLEVRGVGAPHDALIRASVVVDGTEIGRAFLVNRDGRFHGSVPLLPQERPVRADLRLSAFPGGGPLASVPLRIGATYPVAVWSPLPNELVRARSIVVSGAALDAVGEVRAQLVAADRTVLAESVARTRRREPDWRGFELRLAIPPDPRSRPVEVRVGWLDQGGEGAGSSVGVPIVVLRPGARGYTLFRLRSKAVALVR